MRVCHTVEDYREMKMEIEGYDPDHYVDMALNNAELSYVEWSPV